jgi:hypothetical protein
MEGIFDPLLADEIAKMSQEPSKAEIKQGKKQEKTSKAVRFSDVNSPPEKSGKNNTKRENCSTCLLLKPHPYELGNKNMKQWINLYYQINELTEEELCKFNPDPKAIKPIHIPTHARRIKTAEYLKAVVPVIVDNIVRIRLKEERNKMLKKTLPQLCSHRPEQQSKLWLSTKGSINPTFSAIVFPDDPSKSFKSPIMIFNEKKYLNGCTI